tara:strand:- start:511 stop:1380 length:870 start_codon:yes stop_codon:yes gene_type:complete
MSDIEERKIQKNKTPLTEEQKSLRRIRKRREGENKNKMIKKYINKIKSDDIILTFTDTTYLPIFNIFYNYFEKLNLNNLIVISLDENVFSILNKRGILTLLYKYKISSRNNFWRFRYYLIDKIFQLSKKNIIHTDSDCIWIKDITKIPELSFKYDIIGQVAFGHPIKVVKKIGMVLCCGFYKIYFNNNTKYLFKKILRKKYNRGINDDQVMINNYILHEHEQIEENEFGKCITIKNNNIKILLLNTKYISRRIEDKMPLLYHPHLKGNIENKEKQLKLNLHLLEFSNEH